MRIREGKKSVFASPFPLIPNICFFFLFFCVSCSFPRFYCVKVCWCRFKYILQCYFIVVTRVLEILASKFFYGPLSFRMQVSISSNHPANRTLLKRNTHLNDWLIDRVFVVVFVIEQAFKTILRQRIWSGVSQREHLKLIMSLPTSECLFSMFSIKLWHRSTLTETYIYTHEGFSLYTYTYIYITIKYYGSP